MVLPQAMAWLQYWFRVLSLKFCGKSKKICGDVSQVSPAFCMYGWPCPFLVLRVSTGRRTRLWAGWEGRRKNLPPRCSRGCRRYIFYSTIQQVEIELKARIDKVSAEPEIEDSACCVKLRKRVISIFTRCRGHNIHLQCCYLVPPWWCCRRSWHATDVTNSRNFRKSHLVQLSSSRWKFCSILSSHPTLQLPCIANWFVRN